MPPRASSAPELSLAWLLTPLRVEKFLDEIWGTSHYHVSRRSADYFHPMLDASADVDQLVGVFRPDLSLVSLVRRSETKRAYLYRGADGGLDAAAVGKDFGDGYTIVLESVQRYVRAIASLMHSIEVELNYATQVNAYITPPGSQGFERHYDDHDVLILQIRGSKIWHVYDGADVSPHEIARHAPVAPAPLAPPTDIRLEVGDVLYLPRGRVHAAEATSEVSVHLTLGLHAPTVLLLATRALNALGVSDDRVHSQLPPRYLSDPEVHAEVAALVRGAADALQEPRTLALGLESLEDDLVKRGQSPPVGQTLSHAVSIDRLAQVAKYQPLLSRVTESSDGVVLHFAQLTIQAGPDHRDALRFVSKSTAPFRICEMPGLSATQQIELARTLLLSGFLVRWSED